MKLKDLLKNGKTILADGAFGTYYSKLTQNSNMLCELENINNPEIVRDIHRQYIESGAKIIRTNTFSANTQSLNITTDKLVEVIKNGYYIAKGAAEGDTVILADVSAIYSTDENHEQCLEEYKTIIDAFAECGAESFIFETLPNIDTVAFAIDYIKEKNSNAEIILSFAIMPDGCTRSGLHFDALLNSILPYKDKLCAVGINCGCGPNHIYKFAARLYDFISKNTNLFVSVMPNSGYPAVERRVMTFFSDPRYFAKETARLAQFGISILGGCCGTEPEHIRQLSEEIKGIKKQNPPIFKEDEEKPKQGVFSSKLAHSDFVIAVELDPPYGTDVSKLINGAKMLKQAGADIITVSDSPLGQVKMESVLCSAKIKREAEIDTLPHICCRDRNINAIRSALLGAHSEGIRAVLAVTGDHIAESDKGLVKPVFNMSSLQLISLIAQMNNDVFIKEPIAIGGAFNPDIKVAKSQLNRLKKKMEMGATFFLTQPVYSSESIDIIKEARSFGAKILVGIMPLVSYRNAMFLSNEVPGISIPTEILSRFSPTMTREEGTNTGIEIAVELALEYKPHADGFYFMTPFNRAEVVCSIIENFKKN